MFETLMPVINLVVEAVQHHGVLMSAFGGGVSTEAVAFAQVRNAVLAATARLTGRALKGAGKGALHLAHKKLRARDRRRIMRQNLRLAAICNKVMERECS